MRPIGEERGETLIEVLITIIVLSIGLVAVVAAMGTSIIASSAHRSHASGEVVGREFGELLKAEARDLSGDDHIPCPTWTEPELTPGFNRPGWTATIDKVEWWIPDSSDPPQGQFVDADDQLEPDGSVGRDICLDSFTDLCGTEAADAKPTCDPGLQRVTYSVENDLEGVSHIRLTQHVILRRGDG